MAIRIQFLLVLALSSITIFQSTALTRGPLFASPRARSSGTNEMKNEVCVVGGGTIGSSFCSIFLALGKRVVCCDPFVSQASVHQRIHAVWPTLRARGLTKEASPPMSLLSFENDMERALMGVDFIQECTFEEVSNKQAVLGELDRLADPSTIISSSTSFIPHEMLVTQCTRHKERVMLGHPTIPHLDCLMEIYGTSSEWIERTKDWYEKAGFDVIVMKKTMPGHVFNSFLTMNNRHGAKLIRDGICSPEDVNKVARHLGRDMYARHSFLSILSTIGGDRGLQGGIELSAKIKSSAINIIFYSLMKKIWMPDFIANFVGRLMSRWLFDIVDPPPPQEWLEACQELENKVTQNGTLAVQEGLFQQSASMYKRMPYEVGNDPWEL